MKKKFYEHNDDACLAEIQEKEREYMSDLCIGDLINCVFGFYLTEEQERLLEPFLDRKAIQEHEIRTYEDTVCESADCPHRVLLTDEEVEYFGLLENR